MSDDLLLVIIDRNNKRYEVPALEGWRIMEIIRDNELPIKAECGGSGICASCHIYIDSGMANKIPKPSDDEIDQLGAVKNFDKQRSRLSCQVLMRPELDGMTVTLAPGSEP